MDPARLISISPGKTALVIPDLHVKNGERQRTLDRLRAISKMIVDLKPDYAIVMGDVGEFANVADWLKVFDGAKAWQDALAFREALKLLRSFVDAENARHRRNRHSERVYEPEAWYLLEGNHEERWRRRSETRGGDGQRGTWGHDLLQVIAEDLGFTWIPLGEYLWLHKIGFAHFQKTGTKRQAAALSTMKNRHRSFFAVHEHTYGLLMDWAADGDRLVVGKLGCFKPPEDTDVTAGEWSGITFLADMRDGQCMPHSWTYDQVLERYGEGDYAEELRTSRALDAGMRSAAAAAF
ncbi:metallophosphoesterase [Rhodovulum euryhalinum]|uniref:Calcineurin-like phosphoesterase family protein n=1 Tax=Rhodovulum euryhalinum TaxID=35805 RepID=A0A4R2K6U2_9RHOB|nr:metallophosphoesterase [Rhodovulum euryhalinum]TCO69013.1 calcineurin-like phosphoesterase family protein [Rhodovulum euryhalinum]